MRMFFAISHKVFLDTNVLASALTTRGLCADVFQIVLTDHCLFTAHLVLQELGEVLPRKFSLPKEIVSEYLDLILEESTIVEATDLDLSGIPDPDDAPILACALEGGCDVFVTGDKLLLKLRKVDSMPVLSPRAFWAKLSEREIKS